jgi:S1-C subfamily serine protease
VAIPKGGMPKPLASFAVALVAGLTVSACSSTAPATEGQLLGSTLRIDIDACRTGKVRATGISLADGWIATVAHSFDGIEAFRVEGRDLALVYLDLDTDVALLFESDAVGPHLTLATDVDPGPARMVTYPRPDNPPEITAIEVLRLADVTLDGQGRRRALELEADINPGDSGSAVVNDSGEVIGMIFANSRGLDSGWAISADEIATALKLADTDEVEPPRCG